MSLENRLPAHGSRGKRAVGIARWTARSVARRKRGDIGRESIEVYTQLNLDAIHVRIVDTLAAVDETNDAEYVEHLVTKHEEMFRIEDY